MMKKFYLVNYDVTEIAYFNSNDEAFQEVQKRNRFEPRSNWKAYTERGDVVYGIIVCQSSNISIPKRSFNYEIPKN